MNLPRSLFLFAATTALAATHSSATVYDLSGSFVLSAVGAPFGMSIVSGTYNDLTSQGSWTIKLDRFAFYGVAQYDQTFTLDAETGNGYLNPGTNCGLQPGYVGDPAGLCQGLMPAFEGALHTTYDVQEGTNHWVLNTTFGPFDLYPVLTPVPVPAAMWLFGSALLGVVGLTRGRAIR